MRIAYVCTDPGIPVFGQKGCSIHVQEVIRALKHQGVEVELFTVRSGGDAPADLADIPVHKLPSLPKVEPGLREQAALELNQLTMSMLANSSPYDVVYERYSLWSYAGMAYADGQNIPGILEVNAPLIDEQSKHRSLVHKKAAEDVARRNFELARSIIAVSDEVADYIINFANKANSSKVHVIPNGINPERFLHTEKAAQENFVIGFVGTLKPWHGLPYLIKAFAKFYRTAPDARLLVVGDGPQRHEIEALAQQLAITEVLQMSGSVAPEHIPVLLKQMDVAIAPYPELDNFYFSPLKVYEYMAAGIPTIASEIGQLKQLIQNNINGLLTKPGSVTALTNAMNYLYQKPALRQSIALQGQQTVLQNYTWDNVARKILLLSQNQQQDMVQAV